MKKLLLLLITISMFSFTSNAQSEWKEVYESENVKVEMQTIECNPNNRMVPFSYSVLKYTNKTNSDLEFKFEINLWYDNVKQESVVNDISDSPILKSIQLGANQSITGDCSSKADFLRVFYTNNNPEMPRRLTNVEIVAK